MRGRKILISPWAGPLLVLFTLVVLLATALIYAALAGWSP